MKGKATDKARRFLNTLPDTNRLPVCETPKHVNYLLVDRLEGLLKEARDGELLGLAYVCQWKGDLVSSSWALEKMHARKLVGEIEFLKRDIIETVE